MAKTDPQNQKPLLIIDLPLAGKLEGAAWAAAAGTTAGGLTIRGLSAVFALVGGGTAVSEIAIAGIGLMAMGWAGHAMSEALSDDLANRHGVILRKMNPPKWDISRFSFP